MARVWRAAGALLATIAVVFTGSTTRTWAENPSPGLSGNGYWILDGAGGVSTWGDALFHGSVPALRQAYPSIGDAGPVSIAATRSGDGYWILDRAGGVFSFGDALFHGSVPAMRQAGVPIGEADPIDLEPTTSGDGYWILDRAGGIFAFGDAGFFGSVPELREEGHQVGPAHPVDLAATPSGAGYWILDRAGGIFAFGDAGFFGSLPGLREAGQEIGAAELVGLAPTRTGSGYSIVDDAGGVFTFGDAGFFGSIPALREAGRDVGASATAAVAASPTGRGYWMLNQDGSVFGFGDANDCGSPTLAAPAIGLAVPARSDLVAQRLVAHCGEGDTSLFDATSPWRLAVSGWCHADAHRADGTLVESRVATNHLVQIRESGSFYLAGQPGCAVVALAGDGGETGRPFTIGSGGGDSLPFVADSPFTIRVSGTHCHTQVRRDSDGTVLDSAFNFEGSAYTMEVNETGRLYVTADQFCTTTVSP